MSVGPFARVNSAPDNGVIRRLGLLVNRIAKAFVCIDLLWSGSGLQSGLLALALLLLSLDIAQRLSMAGQRREQECKKDRRQESTDHRRLNAKWERCK